MIFDRSKASSQYLKQTRSCIWARVCDETSFVRSFMKFVAVSIICVELDARYHQGYFSNEMNHYWTNTCCIRISTFNVLRLQNNSGANMSEKVT